MLLSITENMQTTVYKWKEKKSSCYNW